MKLPWKLAATLLVFLADGANNLAAVQTAASKTPKPPRPASRESAQRADPIDPLLRQAAAAIEKKEFKAAAQSLESYLAGRPEDAMAHFQLGYVYSALERWEDAKSQYGRAIALNPRLAAAHLNLGLVLLDKEPAAAVEPFRQAAGLLPDQARPRYLLGRALERSGNPPAAIEEYQAAAGLDAKSYEVRFALGRALLTLGRASEAESRFREALTLRSDSAPARLGLAESLLAQKKLGAAADEFVVYLKLHPQDRESRVQLASLLVELKRYDQALAELDQCDLNGQASLASYKLRSEVYLQQEQLAQAAEALQKAAQLAPHDAEVHARLGRLWLEEREFAPAERELRQALQLDPNETDALRDLVAVYYLNQSYPATLNALDLLAQRETPTAGSWFVRATCYDKLERKAEAVAAYQKFLALDQGHSENQDFQARQRIRVLTKELQQRKR